MKITLEVSPEEIIAVLKHMDGKNEHIITEIEKVPVKYIGTKYLLDREKTYYVNKIEWDKSDILNIEGMWQIPKSEFELVV